MKILLVTPSYYPIIGGSETLTRAFSIKLNENGIHADIMTLNMDKKWNPSWKEKIEYNGSFKVYKIPAVNPFNSFPINPMKSLLKMYVIPKPSFIKVLENYDIIHFLGAADLSFPILSYVTQMPKIMHCLGTRGLYLWSRERFYLRVIFKRLFPNLADVFIISSSQELNLLLEIGIPKSKILTLPQSVDTETFHVDEIKKLENLILFVGRIDRIKGLHVLLRAMLHLKLKTRLAIVGPKRDAKYFEEIEEMCHVLNKGGIHKVKYLGAMNESDLVPWYQKAAVLVCPYLEETGSLVCFEAYACGTPVIRTVSHREKDGIGSINGIIVPRNNPEKLAEAIEKLLEDKKLREKYGREGRRIVEQHLSWKSNIKKLIEVYEKILGNN